MALAAPTSPFFRVLSAPTGDCPTSTSVRGRESFRFSRVLRPLEGKFENTAMDMTEPAEDAMSEIDSMGVSIRNPNDVREYLVQHIDVATVCVTACSLASKRFPEHSQLVLEVYHDPEFADEYLTLLVRKERYDLSLLDDIDEVSRQYEQSLAGTSGWFVLTTDFQPPAEKDAV